MAGEVTRQPLGRRLGYAQAVANQTGISAVADVTGLTITFVVPGGPFWVETWIGSLVQNTSTANVILYIADGSNNEVARMWTPQLTAAAGVYGPVFLKRRLVPGITGVAAGATLTLKTRAQTTAGTVDLRMGVDTVPTVNGPGWIAAYAE